MTLARLLRISLALQLAGGGVLGYLLSAPWLAEPALRWLAAVAGAVALPVLVTAGALGGELVIDAIVDPRQPRRGLANALRVWLGETGASLRAFCFRQPFGADFPEPATFHDPRRPAVLLIHGYVCNRAAWRPLLEAGALAGCNVATVDLLPVYTSIDDYATVIGAAVERLSAAAGAPAVVLVAHSMGGLAARAYLRRFGDAAVARVITIATPHAGTRFARLGSGVNARQMRPGSDWLHALDGALTPALRTRFVCIAAGDDNLILPR
ncbi:MAG TPA: alpha/beta fold hydrolase, partial [Burkholderiaceae bacterium]